MRFIHHTQLILAISVTHDHNGMHFYQMQSDVDALCHAHETARRTPDRAPKSLLAVAALRRLEAQLFAPRVGPCT